MVSAKLEMICSGPRRSCDTEPLNASSSRLRHSSSSTSAARVSASCRPAPPPAPSTPRRSPGLGQLPRRPLLGRVQLPSHQLLADAPALVVRLLPPDLRPYVRP